MIANYSLYEYTYKNLIKIHQPGGIYKHPAILVATQYYKSCNTLYLPHNGGSTRTEGALQPPLVNLTLLQLNVFNLISRLPTVHLKMLVQNTLYTGSDIFVHG